MLIGCQESEPKSHFEQIKQRKTITVGTLYGPASYFSSDITSSAIEQELANLFAQRLGVELEVVASSDLPSLFLMLENKQVDILATGLSVTDQRLAKMRFGPPYYHVTQQLVYKQGKKRPREIADLTGNLTVIDGSSHLETLKKLKLEHPQLNWHTTTLYDPDQLLKMLIDEKIDYTVVDSTVLARNRRRYPDISLAMTLSKPQPIAWVISNNTDDSLYGEIIDFFGQIQSDGLMVQLEEKYFGHVQRFDYVDTRAFIKAVSKTLPKYQLLFEQYAGNLSWLQLAATSYQESHWDPRAKSPTGVRGMMMLTLPTAKQVGVTSRLNPEQSIRGGALYLRQLLDRLPETIAKDQQFWFALAAYNLGFGHLMDARKLAKKMNKNPNSWASIKQILPLLEKSKYYKKTRHGFARGREAIHYVDSIRRYYQTLESLSLRSVLSPKILELAAAEDSVPHPIPQSAIELQLN
ncbi:MAG: membrane-bound lytic murein transglycosylase MltF [Gammaproteobacteria bacterium]|nr:membrane-bound lytic murein transglycosylase MltF [Gammaproteobacteria bacterium]